MQERQVVINGQLINYLEEKSSDAAPTVVFLHGWGASIEIWKPVIERLLRQAPRNDISFNIYALDLPGFGKSEMPKQPFTVGDYAEIAQGFIEKVITPLPNPPHQGEGKEKNNDPSLPSGGGKMGGVVYFIGHSFGGRVAIKLAATEPELIKKLVLVDSAGFRDDSARKKVISGLAKIFKPVVPQKIKDKLYKHIGAEDYATSGELKQTFLNIINEDLTEDMEKIKVPTLIIWGEDDRDTPVAFGQHMNSLILNSKLSTLPNAGHYSFLDKPDEFVSEILHFVQSLP